MRIDVSKIDKEKPHACPVCGTWVNASHSRRAITCGRKCGGTIRTSPRVTPSHKVCNRCREDLPIDRFGKDKNRVDGHNSRCRQCISEHRKERAHWRANYRLQWNYGITLEDRDRMYLSQKRRCLICRKVKPKSGLYVDHCHTTGAVRGLLCPKCNWGLGYFKDDIERLRNAIAYLEAHDSRSSAAST